MSPCELINQNRARADLLGLPRARGTPSWQDASYPSSLADLPCLWIQIGSLDCQVGSVRRLRGRVLRHARLLTQQTHEGLLHVGILEVLGRPIGVLPKVHLWSSSSIHHLRPLQAEGKSIQALALFIYNAKDAVIVSINIHWTLHVMPRREDANRQKVKAACPCPWTWKMTCSCMF